MILDPRQDGNWRVDIYVAIDLANYCRTSFDDCAYL